MWVVRSPRHERGERSFGTQGDLIADCLPYSFPLALDSVSRGGYFLAGTSTRYLYRPHKRREAMLSVVVFLLRTDGSNVFTAVASCRRHI